MFEELTPDGLLRDIEQCLRLESALIARRMADIAALLMQRTGEAENASDEDPGYALILKS